MSFPKTFASSSNVRCFLSMKMEVCVSKLDFYILSPAVVYLVQWHPLHGLEAQVDAKLLVWGPRFVWCWDASYWLVAMCLFVVLKFGLSFYGAEDSEVSERNVFSDWVGMPLPYLGCGVWDSWLRSVRKESGLGIGGVWQLQCVGCGVWIL